MVATRTIWVFNGGPGRFPGGIFSSVDRAEAWIRKHRLSGVLTEYPVDEGCFDWACRLGKTGMSEATLRAKLTDPDPEFIGGFSSACQEHYHYEQGERESHPRSH